MKYAKNILFCIIAFFFLWSNYVHGAYTLWDIERQAIEQRLDKFFDDRTRLELIRERVASIDIKNSWWNQAEQEVVRVLLPYIIEYTEVLLQAIDLREETQRIENEVREEEILSTTSPTEIVEIEQIEKEEVTVIQSVTTELDIALFEEENETFTILAGESGLIYEIDVSANLESLDVGEVVFELTSPDSDFVEQTIDSASLYLDNNFIATNTSSDVEQVSWSRFIIRFDNLQTLIIPEEEKELKLLIHTRPIWFQKIGRTMRNIIVEEARFDDVEGLTSWRDSGSSISIERGYSYDIVPGVVDVEVLRDLSFSTKLKIDLIPRLWWNTRENNNSVPPIILEEIRLDVWGINPWDAVFLLDSDRLDWTGVRGSTDGRQVVFNLRGVSGNNIFQTEEYEITLSWISDNATVFLDLARDGILYSIPDIDGGDDLSLQKERDIDLWSRVFR